MIKKSGGELKVSRCLIFIDQSINIMRYKWDTLQRETAVKIYYIGLGQKIGQYLLPDYQSYSHR